MKTIKLEKRDYDGQQLQSSFSKRSNLTVTTSSTPQSNKCSLEKNDLPAPHSVYNLLDEPSPIGLKLKKSPSFLDLIQMRLSSDASSMAVTVPKSEIGTTAANSTAEKTKASNFAASLLRIGSWEFVSKYSGDLVAKCYYAKHKLVWEILQGSLKNKMEIQWSDIMALQANCPDDGPGTMTIALNQPPMFYRESEPQPRKHTLWQRSADFTNGQASINVKHYLEFPQGVLNKHYEKLIQCDARLKHLSQQPKIVLESMLYFTRDFQREVSDGHGGQYLSSKASSVSCFSDDLSPSSLNYEQMDTPSSLNYEQMDTGSSVFSKEAASPSTVLGTYANEEINNWKHLNSGLQGLLHPSMSMTDLVNHIETRFSDELTSGNIPKDKAPECQHILENISEVLLSDNTHNNTTASSDEKSVMKRVDSLFNLLHDPVATDNNNHNIDEKSVMKKVDSFLSLMQLPSTSYSLQQMNDFNGFCDARDDFTDFRDTSARDLMQENNKEGFCDISPINVSDALKIKESTPTNVSDALKIKEPTPINVSDALKIKETTPNISRKDSFVDMLFQLPRIASLSQLFSDISEDN